MKYILHGPPTPLQRPRFTRGHVYDPQQGQKLLDGIQLKKQHHPQPPLEVPLLATITFFMPLAKYLREPGRDRLRGKYNPKRPDLDNMIKYILDAANGILYTDDSLIVQISGKKIWADVGKTELILEQADEIEASK